MADGLGFNWVGLKEVQKAFVGVGKQVDMAAAANVREAATLLISEAMKNFDGADQPVARTGHLRRSIMSDGLRHPAMGVYSTTVGPDDKGGMVKYARRVELGFRGADSLGRIYDQGPRPYFGPAAAKLRREMAAIATANWAKYLKL